MGTAIAVFGLLVVLAGGGWVGIALLIIGIYIETSED